MHLSVEPEALVKSGKGVHAAEATRVALSHWSRGGGRPSAIPESRIALSFCTSSGSWRS